MAALAAIAGARHGARPVDDGRPGDGQRSTSAGASRGAVVVTYHLEGAVQPEDRKELESGQTVTFTHRIDVYRRRSFFADRWLARRTIETSASLDTLTEQYTLTRRIDDGAAETTSTERVPVMEKWLGEVRNFTVEVPPNESRGTLEVRVKTQYRKGFLLFVWPRELTAVGDAECR